MTHPFQSLVVEALNLMHPRFATAHGREYTPAEAEEPSATRKVRERSFVMEFYSEFRRMWDKAIPVQRGLGHILIQGDPDALSRQPDLLFWQLGEHGAPNRRFGAVSLVFGSNPAAVAADMKLLARFHELGYAHAFCVVIGKATDAGPEAMTGVTLIRFDTDKWQVI